MKKIGLLFPGQGSQYIGMGKNLYEASDRVKSLFEEADEAAGFPLTELMFSGPEEELRKTFNTQPAVLLNSYAAWVMMKEHTGIEPLFLAGHSLGEYTALLVSGLFQPADAVRVTRTRGLLMEEACPAGTGGMVALMGPDRQAVEKACAEVSREGYIASPANLNSPEQLVLSGTVGALKEVVEKLKGTGYKKAVFLNVSGPFHCALMKPAAEKLREELGKVQLSDMSIPVISNVEAAPNLEPSRTIDLLYRQMFSPVRWEDTIRAMVGNGVELFIEVGPQKVLTNLVKRITPDVPCSHVESMEEIEAVKEMIS
jgi:[acyl-carrier-protein] S-malonyltransferase